MLLKFHAKADALQCVPDFHPAIGQHDRYVGREHDAANPGAFPASKEPFECDSDSSCGQRLRHLIYRDRDLWPADQATADYCQVPFVRIEWAEGEWIDSAKKFQAAKPAVSPKD